MPLSVSPNPPYKRFAYIAKQYGDKHPDAVLDTFWVLSDTVGIERPADRFGWAMAWRSVVSAPSAATRYGMWETGRFRRAGSNEEHTPSELLQMAVEELSDVPEMQRGRESDALWPWVARELVRSKEAALESGDVDDYIAQFDELRGRGPALSLWQQQNRVDLGRVSLDEAVIALADFEVAGRRVPQGNVEYQWPDGWTVQRLTEPEQLKAEGEVMQHCVGEYCSQVAEGATIVYSLRDPAGNPHATVEFNNALNRFVQVQGKQNQTPLPKYMNRVKEFAATRNIIATIGLTSDEAQKLEAYGDDLGYDAWQEASSRSGFAIVDSEEPDIIDIDLHDVVEDVFPHTDPHAWSDAGLETDIEDTVSEAARSRWEEEWSNANDTLESIIADLVDEAPDEDELEEAAETALNESGIEWGRNDLRHVVSEVES